MKKNMLKLLCIMLTIIMAFSFAACDKTETTEATETTKEASEPTSESTDKVEEQVSEEPVVYEIFYNWTSPQFPEDGGVARQYLIDEFAKAGINNVDFKVHVISGDDDYATKLNLMIASGDVPDYFHVTDIEMANRLADEGIIAEITDEWLEMMPNYTRYVRDKDVNALTYNDKLYVLPQLYRPEVFNGPNTGGFVVREDWLTNLGIENPTTLDEMHDMLYAFTYNDPDQNGEDDTYGLGGKKGDKFESIFGAFGVIPEFWFERDGRLQQGFTLPETKEALQVLQDWYLEGLIDPDFPIMDSKQRNEKCTTSVIGVFRGSAFNTSSVNSNHSNLRSIVEGSRLIMLNTPEGPDGYKGWADVAPGGGKLAVVSADVEDPIRLLQMIDWACSDIGAPICQFGRPGEEFVYHEDTNTIEQFISKNTELYALGFGNPARFISVIDRRWMTEWGFTSIEKTHENIIENAYWGTVPEMFDYPDINKLWEEYMIKIITGIEPVDAWDEFVDKYYQAGGQAIEDAVNEAVGN